MSESKNGINAFFWGLVPGALAALAPDGMVVQQNYDNSLSNAPPGQAFEWQVQVPEDDRIAKIVVWSSMKQ